MSPKSKGKMFAGSGDRLISACHGISSLAELRKAKSVKFIGVRIDSFIRLNGICRDGNKRPCRNSHAIGKCERAHGKTTSRYLIMGRAHQHVVFGRQKKRSNEQWARPSIRWVSRMKLSILCILSIPTFVHPSCLITASTSSRRGSIYSGFARRRYNTCVNVY
jgi:hypothetical protein